MQHESSYKKLYRSSNERMIAGVCGGLAEYFNIDPTWVRLFFVFFFLAFGSALVLYLVLWVLVPLKSGDDSSERPPKHVN